MVHAHGYVGDARRLRQHAADDAVLQRSAADAVYEYYVNDANVLKICFEYEYYDGEEYVTTSDSYTFDMTLTHEGTQMILSYDPWIGPVRRYYFQRLV